MDLKVVVVKVCFTDALIAVAHVVVLVRYKEVFLVMVSVELLSEVVVMSVSFPVSEMR